MKKGSVYAKWYAEVKAFADANKNVVGFEKEAEKFCKAVDALAELQGAVIGFMGAGKIDMMPLYARRILTASSIVYGAWCILEQGIIAQKRAEEVGKDHFDYDFYIGKVYSAKYYINNVVPQVWSIAEVVKEGDDSALEIPAGAFDY